MDLPTDPRAHHRILAIDVSGGFLDGVRLDFADGLNCIIGGRGTGKTTILEFIRYVLGQMPDPTDNRPRARAIEAIIKGNLGSGTIRLDVETRHGTRYRAERPWEDSVQVADADGQPVAVSLDRDLVFKADIYSQNEIEEIATTPRFQLPLIDKFAEEAVRAATQEVHRAKRTIEASSVELRNLDHRIRELAELVPEAEVVAKRLAEMQAVAGPEAAPLNAAHRAKALRASEVQAIDDLRRVVRTTGEGVHAFAASVADQCGTALGDDLVDGPNGVLFRTIAEATASFVAVFRGAIPMVDDRCARLFALLDRCEGELRDAHARQEQDYRALVARSTEQQQHAAERARLQQRQLELTAARKELDGLQRKRQGLEASHRDLTARLSGLRDQRFALRRAVTEALSAALMPTIRVSITQAGDRSGYRELLCDELRGSGMQYNRLAARIVETVSPEELSRMIRRGTWQNLAERASLSDEQAQRVVGHLAAGDAALRLETIDLEDEPLIELKDGETYKNSTGLSTGQRCTVILPILLLDSERPLLIDQPEDNLDNAFVYDTIVRSLREAKGGRQLVFVTHNPNIPVLGEAERIFVVTSDGQHATPAAA
ncbi:MAG: hypothetical protein EPN20_18175 [Magnetospirillum sp.]|nr:MAG: hypothetical protein EPN20_18175 [Magnetospirillum sp.]